MANFGFSEVEGCTRAHLEHLRGSAISIDVMRERGYRTIDVAKRLEEFGFSKQQRRVPGILIPLHAPDGSAAGHQFRPDNPRLSSKDKPIKYETPQGAGLRLDMPPRCRDAAGDPSVPIWITEGAKKADALASFGACAINLSGVWAFKGKNAFGASTLLADFDLIAWKGRDVYPAFDSDILTKPQVNKALKRLSAHVARLGAKVHIVQLPNGPDGAKTGVDDFLAAGHTLEDIKALASDTPPEPEKAEFELEHELYFISAGRICMRKGDGTVPLGNFTARISEEIILDDGVEEALMLDIEGQIEGRDLPRLQVPVAAFENLNWALKGWGPRCIIRAGSSSKDHLRCAIQAMSNLNGSRPRRIYRHTGWREIDGERVFLGGAGAIGRPDVQVELQGDDLSGYHLPIEPGDVDALEAIRTSISFLEVSSHEVTYSLWAAMYLAPLAEELKPAFSLWLLGRTGAFKSVLTALAGCHFGNFTHTELPANWYATANFLEKSACLLKDHPLIIDDSPPGVTTAAARDLETKVERVIRSQGNKSGRGRLQSDTGFRSSYVPRGIIVTSGEQLIASESAGARLLVVPVEESATDPDVLTWAQAEAGLYKYAMADYCTWLQRGWDRLMPPMHEEWEDLRHEAMEHGIHRRLPAVVASMTVAFRTAMAWAVERGAIEPSAAEKRSEEAWQLFLRLADQQGARVNEQRAATRFLDALSTLLTQQRVHLVDRACVEPYVRRENCEFIGWYDSTRLYLMPDAAYKEVFTFCQKGGQPLQFKPSAIWADLARLELIETREKDGKTEYTPAMRFGHGRDDSRLQRVVALARSAVSNLPEQGILEGVL